MTFFDGALRMLYEAIGGEEVRPKNFTMDNARKFYDEKRREFPQAKNCVLQVVPHGKSYEVVQLILDENLEIIKLDSDLCVGRHLMAENVADDVWQFLKGKEWQLLS